MCPAPTMTVSRAIPRGTVFPAASTPTEPSTTPQTDAYRMMVITKVVPTTSLSPVRMTAKFAVDPTAVV